MALPTLGHFGDLKWGLAVGAATGILVYTLAAGSSTHLHVAPSLLTHSSHTVIPRSRPATIAPRGARSAVYAIPPDALITPYFHGPITHQVDIVSRLAMMGGAVFCAALSFMKFKHSKPKQPGDDPPAVPLVVASHPPAPPPPPPSRTMTMATTVARPVAPSLTATGTTKHSKIRSSLKLPENLKEFWYPVVFTKDLKEDTLTPVLLFGTDWVVFRDKDGKAACIRDECAHRACPLSIGSKKDGQVVCPYHGWTFNATGACTEMPSTTFNPDIRVSALQCREGDGFVWIWTGAGEPPQQLPDWTNPPKGYTLHCEHIFDVGAEHGLLIENLLDLAHAPFTHTSTFAKGWPIPEVVRFHTSRLFGGNWDPYPIDMSFEPPCGVISTIGIEKPGDIKRGSRATECKRHLWQLHVCLPSSQGRTRLLYRMGLDFWDFAKDVPFIDLLWKNVADRVLSEDLPLVVGQQSRMESGGDVWANPVSYDKLGVRYRRWRNSLEEKDEELRVQMEAELRMPFSAGELFSAGSALDTRAAS